jgi:hypothetical protein
MDIGRSDKYFPSGCHAGDYKTETSLAQDYALASAVNWYEIEHYETEETEA